MGAIKYCTMPEDMFLAKYWKTEEWYLDDQVFSLLVSTPSKKGDTVQYHLAVLKEGAVLRLGEWNPALRKDIRDTYVRSLTEALTKVMEKACFWEEAPRVSLRFGVTEEEQKEQEKGPALRLVLVGKGVLPMEQQEEERLRKELRAEFSDWLEMVLRDVSARAVKKEMDKKLSAYVSADLLPHEREGDGADLAMTLLSILFLALAFVFRELFLFQVLAIGVAGCGAFRSAQHKRYVYLAICAVVVAAGLALAWFAFQELKESMQGVSLPTQN